MNKEKIDLVKKKFPGWFEDHVSCNMYHDPVTDQMNQYPVFSIRFAPLLNSLTNCDVIQSDETSNSFTFIEHIEDKVERYIDFICEKALK